MSRGHSDLFARAREHGATVFAARRETLRRWDRLVTSRLFKTVLRMISGVPSDVGTFFVVSGEVAEAMCTVGVRSPHVVVLAYHCSREAPTMTVIRATRAAGMSAYSIARAGACRDRSIDCALPVAGRRAEVRGMQPAGSADCGAGQRVKAAERRGRRLMRCARRSSRACSAWLVRGSSSARCTTGVAIRCPTRTTRWPTSG